MSQYIHIALIGAVSAGKSTLLNAMLVERYSDMSMQRTTANEIIYYETDDEKTLSSNDIHSRNQNTNREIMDKTTKGDELKITDIKKIEYNVPKIYKLLENKLKPGIQLALHDLPGLNDSKTSSVYHQYVTEQFHQYDIVLFIVDVVSGLNTCDEKNILKLIINGIMNNKQKYGVETEFLVILNKCDEMEIVDKNSHEARPIDNEYKSMVEQVRTIVKTTAETMKMDQPIRFICLSGEDAYIYRMYSRNPNCEIDPKHRNKFGINEYGKNQWNKMNETAKDTAFKARMGKDNIASVTELTGFTYFDWKLSNILTFDKQFIYLVNHLKFEMSEIKMTAKTPDDTIDVELERISVINDKLKTIQKKYKYAHDISFFSDKFMGFLKDFFGINTQYLIPLKPTKDDSTTYAISTKLTKIFTSINEKFKDWVNGKDKDEVTDKNLIVKDNIDKYLSEVIACHATTYDVILDMFGKFIDYENKCKAIEKFCYNLCNYDFIQTECCTLMNDEGKMATRIISIIKEVAPHFKISQGCYCLIQNIRIITNNWCHRTGTVYNADPYIMTHVFDKYYINSVIGQINGYDIRQQLNIIKSWTYKNMGKDMNGIKLAAILMDMCLDKLNQTYPKHVVNLDVFYGVSREYADLSVDIFYADEKRY